MNVECSECEHDLRTGHEEGCSRCPRCPGCGKPLKVEDEEVGYVCSQCLRPDAAPPKEGEGWRVVTNTSRKGYPHHTDGAIRGIQLVSGLSTDELTAALGDGAKQEVLRLKLGEKTNPNWLHNRIAEELYSRGEIDEEKLDEADTNGAPPPSDAAPVDCENCKTLEQWVHDCQAGMYINCVYCGYRYGPDDEVAPTMQQALYDHIAECPKHPLSAMKRRAERAEARLAHLTDAASVAWRWREYLRPRTVFPFWGGWHPQNTEPDGGSEVEVQPLYAHPAPRPDKASQGSTVSGGERPEQVEDAPGGPWEAVHDGKKRKTTVQLYRRPDNRYIRGLETEAEAIAVRDALNRPKRRDRWLKE